ncbi:MAG TPA: DnaA regulatory inactivator Hda [Gammaproteobacteria bacterium]|nr:DnaA regulatory inactivator Hda [Gammaproteobacteria bacterium]
MRATGISSQLPLPISLDAGATFENFYPGANRAAVEALMQLARAGGERSVFLWGGDGRGKSHLLQAACRLADLSTRHAIYLPMAQAVLLDPQVVENLDSYALVAVDDIHRIAGIEPWQRALLVLFDALAEKGGSFVATARNAPNAIKRLLPDLASRLAWGPVFQLEPLTDEEKIIALKQRASRRGFELPDESVHFLLKRQQRDMHTLCTTLDALDTASLVAQRKLTLPFVKSLLGKKI